MTTTNQRKELRGVGVSSGIGLGRARVMAKAPLTLPQYSIDLDDVRKEVARLKKAIASVDREIAAMGRRAPRRAPKEVAAFLEVFRMLVNDATLFEDTCAIIRNKLINAEWALALHLEESRKIFDNLQDSYLAERGNDIEHVVERLQEELLGSRQIQEEVRSELDEVILVTSDLSLADVIWLTEYEDLDLVGIITEKGGPTSHTAVLSQTLFIPAVVGVAGAREAIQNGDLVFVDSHEGRLICCPGEEEMVALQDKVKEQERQNSERYLARRRVAQTTDGYKVKLFANVAMVSGLDEVLHQGAQGVGLFRSEYLFMSRDKLPDEQEQYESYRALIKAMGGRAVTIRTLDVGGDKLLNSEVRLHNPALAVVPESEDNPALGLRAIRFALTSPDLFLTQLRAIFRAAAGSRGKVRVMLPMVTSLEEIREAKRYVELAKSQLKTEGVAFNDNCPLGIMIEVPAVALRPEPFLREVDFASIGTNDLTQYTLAVDRGNATVAPIYDEMNPAVLELIAKAAQAAVRLKKPISVCGEMGGRPELAPFFIGLGVNMLSMAAMQIPLVKEVIRSCSKADCEVLVNQTLACETSKQVRETIQKFSRKE